jgi:6-phosphogluconolactonase (cycloisomerase 2 family)
MDVKGISVRRRSILAAGVAGAALAVVPEAAGHANAAELPAAAGGAGKSTYAYVSTNGIYTPGSSSPIGISVYRLDPKAGGLTLVQSVTDSYPSWIEIDPSKRFLHACYALSSGTQLVGQVEAYAIDPASGKLQFLNEVSLGATGPAQLVVSPDGRYAVVANYFYAQFVVLPIAEDGRFGPVSGSWTDTGSGPNPRQDSPHPHAVVFDPTGRFLGTADLGNDRLQTFRLVDGGLQHVSEVATPAGMGPRHIVFSPDGRTLYVIGELNGNIMAFGYDPATGAIGQARQTLPTSPPGFTGAQSGAEIALHPSGRFLYGSNRGSETVTGYRIDRPTGKLSVIGYATQGISGPTNFAIDPSGRWLYVNSQTGNDIVQFDIDAGTGQLTPSGRTTALFAPNVMTFRTGGRG